VIQDKQTPNIEAFEKWLNAFDQGKNDLTLDSIHAAVFLINMRSLAWYTVNGGHIQVENKQQVLDLLSEQVKVASNMLITLNELLLTEKDKSVCSMAQYEKYIKEIKDDISLIIVIEKELKHLL
jgi:ribosomal 50S subunit-recycling heat shock protein